MSMPIHEYIPIEPPGCALCCYGIERLERLSDPPLAQCAACGAALRRVIGTPAVVTGGAHLLREGHLARNGFTQYRKVGKGRYEKTTGEGPDTIGGD